MNAILNDLNVHRILLDISAGLVIVGLHGFLLAFFARMLGDPGPARDGRMTVNPFAHLDVFALAGFLFAQLGWIKPMDIRAREIKGGIIGIAAAVLLALAATWVIGQAAMAGRIYLVMLTPPDFLAEAEAWLFTFTRLSERFALFNLLPILTLSAAHILREQLPESLRDQGFLMSGLTLVLAILVKIWIG